MCFPMPAAVRARATRCGRASTRAKATSCVTSMPISATFAASTSNDSARRYSPTTTFSSSRRTTRARSRAHLRAAAESPSSFARPLLSLLFPKLADIEQPLGGEYAARRSALEVLPFVEGWGVDLALLVDLVARFGREALAQVDLDVREHRNRPLEELAPRPARSLPPPCNARSCSTRVDVASARR